MIWHYIAACFFPFGGFSLWCVSSAWGRYSMEGSTWRQRSLTCISAGLLAVVTPPWALLLLHSDVPISSTESVKGMRVVAVYCCTHTYTYVLAGTYTNTHTAVVHDSTLHTMDRGSDTCAICDNRWLSSLDDYFLWRLPLSLQLVTFCSVCQNNLTLHSHTSLAKHVCSQLPCEPVIATWIAQAKPNFVKSWVWWRLVWFQHFRGKGSGVQGQAQLCCEFKTSWISRDPV